MLDNTINSKEILPLQRQAGVCLHITSLPGHYGIGEIGDSAKSFIDQMVRMNLRVWQFLPTGPTAYADSPYQPLSTFAGNELLIDTATLIREGLVTSNEADSLINLPASSVDYGALIPKKKILLDRAAGRFRVQASTEMLTDFDQFLARNDNAWLHEYALFRILKTQHQDRSWPEWRPDFAHREEKALLQTETANGHEIERIKIIQYLFHRQWRQLREFAEDRGILLFGDMPIYIALDSADAWANREVLCLDHDGRPNHVAGVPPDYFSEDGQLWGNPLYDWDVHAANGYRWWIDRLRKSTELVDLVRIDHFRGFEAYWSIPREAKTARIGEWKSGPGGAIFDAIHGELRPFQIVAEDLGVITPAVDEMRNRHNIPGMRVLQFEVNKDDFDINNIPYNCVCYTGTHDNNTIVGWFHDKPNDDRSRARILDIAGGHSNSIHHNLIRVALSSNARLTILALQDFLGLGAKARFNTPGTTGNNWRWRMTSDQITPSLVDSIGDMVAESTRSIAARAI